MIRLSDKQVFLIIYTPILAVCLWITIGVINGVLHPAPDKPDAREIYQSACIKNGGVPDTNINADNWSCKK